jgi:4-carboxymuconolactone decarboxylase
MSDYAKRTKRGFEIIKKMGFPQDKMMKQKETYPDLYDLTVGHLFGDIWSRPHLSLRDRELITIASIVAQGRLGALSHFRSAANSGISKEELMELIIQVGAYAGWPVMTPAIMQYNQGMEENAKENKKRGKRRGSLKKRVA